MKYTCWWVPEANGGWKYYLIKIPTNTTGMLGMHDHIYLPVRKYLDTLSTQLAASTMQLTATTQVMAVAKQLVLELKCQETKSHIVHIYPVTKEVWRPFQ